VRFPVLTNSPIVHAASRRQAELARIRRLIVPDLVFRLHHALFETRTLIPSCVSPRLSFPLLEPPTDSLLLLSLSSSCSNLSRALALPNLVADERHELYREFIPLPGAGAGALGIEAYLDEVRVAALASLEMGMGPVGVGAKAVR